MKLISKTLASHLLLLLAASASQAEVSDNFFLKFRTFKIQSLVNRIGLGDYLNYHVIEHYSLEQRRARIKFSQANTALEAPWQEFIYDAKTNKAMQFESSRPSSCREETSDELISLLFDNCKAVRQLLAESDSHLSHVVGPIRLLFHLIDKVSMWRQVPVDANDLMVIRNQKVVIFEVILRDQDKQIATCRLLYDQASFNGSMEAMALSQLPLRLIVVFSELHQGAFIDYSHLQLDEWALSGPQRHPMSSAGRQLDEFSFPLGRNCSRLFYQPLQRDLFENYDLGSIRFSFTARSLAQYGESKSQFVAYDGLSGLMRVDTREIRVERGNAGHRIGRRHSRLIDFRLNRQFTWAQDEPTFEDLDAPKLRNKCLVTSVLAPERDRASGSGLKLSSFLLAGQRFVYMGRARVRGADVSVYESYTRRLPFWFQPPLVYLDKRTQRFGLRQPGGRLSETNSSAEPADGHHYNVLVYLSEEEEEEEANPSRSALVRPLMLEVFDLDTLGPAESRRRALLVRFHSFMWELNEAPGGEQAHQLFEHHRSCLTLAGSLAHFAQVELELVGQLESAKSWLSEVPKRQSAVATALRDSLELSSLMSYGLESKLVASDTIKVSFRLAEQAQLLYRLTFLGNGRRRYGSWIETAGRLAGAQSPFDCLWLLDQSAPQQRLVVLYLESKQVCLMDQVLSVSAERSLAESSLFEMQPEWPGEIYLLEGQLDAPSSGLDNRSLLLESKLARLQDRLVVMQNFRPDDLRQPIDEQELRLRVKRLRLRNLDHQQQVVAGSSGFVFAGFGLAPGELVWELEQRSPDRQLSLAQCEAGCLAELTCRSFAYCGHWPRATCRLAAGSLAAPETGELLRSDELRRLARGTRFPVALPDGRQLELEREPKCELRAKLYLSMFARGPSSQVSLEAHQVWRVAGEEQCAQRCFLQAVRSLERAQELRERMARLLAEQAGGAELEQLKRELGRLEGSSFCREFLFLEGSLEPEAAQQLDSIAQPDAEGSGAAYCALYEHSLRRPHPPTARLYFDSYALDVSSLYERRTGVALAASNRTEAEEAAFQALVRQPDQPAALEAYAHLQRAASELGRNFQRSASVREPSSCASQCLFRSAGALPTCRSFDLIYTDFHTVCQLNSVSLAQLGPEDPLVLRAKLGAHLVHWEPRFGLLRRRAKLDAQLWPGWLLSSRQVVFHRPNRALLFVCLLLVAAATGGLWLGATLAKQLALREALGRRRSSGSMAAAIVQYSSADEQVRLPTKGCDE